MNPLEIDSSFCKPIYFHRRTASHQAVSASVTQGHVGSIIAMRFVLRCRKKTAQIEAATRRNAFADRAVNNIDRIIILSGIDLAVCHSVTTAVTTALSRSIGVPDRLGWPLVMPAHAVPGGSFSKVAPPE